jgi:hypothetical protein
MRTWEWWAGSPSGTAHSATCSCWTVVVAVVVVAAAVVVVAAAVVVVAVVAAAAAVAFAAATGAGIRDLCEHKQKVMIRPLGIWSVVRLTLGRRSGHVLVAERGRRGGNMTGLHFQLGVVELLLVVAAATIVIATGIFGTAQKKHQLLFIIYFFMNV